MGKYHPLRKNAIPGMIPGNFFIRMWNISLFPLSKDKVFHHGFSGSIRRAGSRFPGKIWETGQRTPPQKNKFQERESEMDMKKIGLLCFGILFAVTAIGAESTRSLPPPDQKGGKPLMQVLTERKSARAYDENKKMDMQTLSNLLYAAYGVNRPDGRHTAPTARNLQDMYLYVALPDGTYLYEPATHSLKLVSEKDLRGEFGKQSGMFRSASAAIAYVSDTSKFSSDRDKIFYPANHAGYISQNVYLFCASEGLSTVVCAMVDRDALAKALGLPAQMQIQLCQPVGYPKK